MPVKHVERFFAPTLGDMIRSGRIRSAFFNSASPDFTFAFNVGGTGLQPADVRLLKLELRGILDRDEALAIGRNKFDKASSIVVLPLPVPPEMSRKLCRRPQPRAPHHRGPQGAEFDEPVHVENALRELFGSKRADHRRDRLDRDVDARTVGKPGVACEDSSTSRRPPRHPVDDAQQVRFVLKWTLVSCNRPKRSMNSPYAC